MSCSPSFRGCKWGRCGPCDAGTGHAGRADAGGTDAGCADAERDCCAFGQGVSDGTRWASREAQGCCRRESPGDACPCQACGCWTSLQWQTRPGYIDLATALQNVYPHGQYDWQRFATSLFGKKDLVTCLFNLQMLHAGIDQTCCLDWLSTSSIVEWFGCQLRNCKTTSKSWGSQDYWQSYHLTRGQAFKKCKDMCKLHQHLDK